MGNRSSKKRKEKVMLRAKSRQTMLLAAAVMVLAGSAYAQKPDMEMEHGGRRCMVEGRGEHMMMIPDITEQQKEQIKSLRVEHMKEMKPLRNQLAEKKARLNTLTTADKVDMSEVNKIIDEIGKMKTGIMKLKEQHRQDVRKLLTDDQRLFFDSHQPMHHEGPQHKAMPHMR
ncbi:MAG: periplasmic heavy metal sensor [candidate division WOR-3 bacterium]|nr:MAG: periplasmic heavy metal sensor [candidate division WOR-3 bacterium]